MEFQELKKLILDKESHPITNLCSKSHKEWPNTFDFMHACAQIGLRCRIYNKDKNEL